jgi:protein-S-isoprenylcysteine O-methyltransferase Ste14
MTAGRSWWGRVWDWLTGPWGVWHRVFRCDHFDLAWGPAYHTTRHPRYPWMLCVHLDARPVPRDNVRIWLISMTYAPMTPMQRWLARRVKQRTGEDLYRVGPVELPPGWTECKP